jgi:hypothetical protein
MLTEIPAAALQLRSLVKADQTVELFLETVEVPEPGPGEVVVRVEASPINPSDLGLLLAGADVTAAVSGGTADRPVVTAPLPDAAMRAMGGRAGIPMPVGNEGAGTVVAAGSSAAAGALLGKTVAVAGGGMYAQYRCVDASLCLELPEGTRAVDGASSFVNPMTVLGMVETMRLENHVAQILTCMEAAASAAAGSYSRYGSSVHKQVHIYGSLDRGTTELTRNFGMAWGIGGWLLTPFLQRIGPDGMERLRQRVAAELTTTFASTYTDQVSLAGALQLDAIAAYARQATGSKYLIIPSL